jgi:hypothetical protein
VAAGVFQQTGPRRSFSQGIEEGQNLLRPQRSLTRLNTGDAYLGWKIRIKNGVRKKLLKGDGLHPVIETGGYHRRQENGMEETNDKQERHENGLRDWS